MALKRQDSGPARDRLPVHSARHADGGIALGAGPLTVPLTIHEATIYDEQIEALSDEQRLYLVINNYKAEAQPGVLYHV